MDNENILPVINLFKKHIKVRKEKIKEIDIKNDKYFLKK